MDRVISRWGVRRRNFGFPQVIASLAALGLLANAVQAQDPTWARVKFGWRALPSEIKEILSWLPTDTESLMVARGRYLPPPKLRPGERTIVETQEIDGKPVSVIRNTLTGEVQRFPGKTSSDEYARRAIEISGLSYFEFLGDAFIAHLQQQPLRLTVSAARRFGTVTTIPGGTPFEGCTVLLFERGIPEGPTNVRANHQLRPDRLGNHNVMRLEIPDDSGQKQICWFAHPRPDVLVAANDAKLLTTLLERMSRPDEPCAFPAELVEWENLPTDAPFWGVRHQVMPAATGTPQGSQPQSHGLSYFQQLQPRPELVVRYHSASRDPQQALTSMFQSLHGRDSVLPKIQRIGDAMAETHLPFETSSLDTVFMLMGYIVFL